MMKAHIAQAAEQIEQFTLKEALVLDAQGGAAGLAKEGRVWEVVIVKSGLSLNGIFYPDATLREAVKLFDGARVYVKSDEDHVKKNDKNVERLFGWLSDVTFVQGRSPDTGYLTGMLNVGAQFKELRETIVEAWKRGKRDLVGLSINAAGKVSKALREGYRLALSIVKVESVDLIVEPAAGGALVRMVEAADHRGRIVDIHSRFGDGDCRAGKMLDDFFSSPNNRSFRECYVEITGDRRLTGRLEDCDLATMREALDTNSWPNVFGAAVTRRMVAEYRGRMEQWGLWRKLVRRSEPLITDFRTQHRVRFGGHGDLPTVNQGAPYLALQSPADESASYALTKRGGTETITFEMVKNDDISAIKLLPKRLAEAAHRTLAHFVLDFLRTNPVIYDGVSLFHVSRNNLGNAPLSASALNAARAALKKQTEPGSGEQLGTEPAYLVVPLDLEETAYNLFQRGANQDKTFIQRMNLTILPIWYWTDANDWCVAADPEQLPCIELGFLDGVDEPELFYQDDPGVGSLFANDQLTFKIRHIYGGAVVDYRGLYKSVVP